MRIFTKKIYQFLPDQDKLRMLFKACLLLLAITAASAQTRVNFRPCAGLPAPLWVESTMCTATLCTLRRGQVFTARAAFSPPAQFSTLTVGIAASVFDVNFPMAIPSGFENACGFLEAGASCPVQGGGSYVWGIQFPVDGGYPLVSNLVIQRKSYKLRWK